MRINTRILTVARILARRSEFSSNVWWCASSFLVICLIDMSFLLAAKSGTFRQNVLEVWPEHNVACGQAPGKGGCDFAGVDGWRWLAPGVQGSEPAAAGLPLPGSVHGAACTAHHTKAFWRYGGESPLQVSKTQSEKVNFFWNPLLDIERVTITFWGDFWPCI